MRVGGQPLLLAAVVAAFALCTLAAPPPEQSAALTALYTATSGAQWRIRTNWLTGDPCGWYGVSCDAANDVVALNLQLNRLRGSLPPAVSDLTALTYVDRRQACAPHCITYVIAHPSLSWGRGTSACAWRVRVCVRLHQ